MHNIRRDQQLDHEWAEIEQIAAERGITTREACEVHNAGGRPIRDPSMYYPDGTPIPIPGETNG